MAIPPVSIGTRVPKGPDNIGDFNTLIFSLNSLATAVRITPLSLTAANGQGNPAADMNTAVNKLNEAIGAFNLTDFTPVAWNNQPMLFACGANSLTLGAGASNPDTTSYPGQLKTLIGSNATVIKRAVTGRTTRQALLDIAEIDNLYSATAYVRNLYLLHDGINDLSNFPLQETKDNIKALIQGRVAKGFSVYASTLLPCQRADIQADRTNFNNWIRANWRAMGATGFIDLAANPYFDPYDKDKSYDGLHWGDAAYLVMAQMFFYAVVAELNKFSVPIDGTAYSLPVTAPVTTTSDKYVAAVKALNPFYYNRMQLASGTSSAPVIGTAPIAIPAGAAGGDTTYWNEPAALFGAENHQALKLDLSPYKRVGFLFWIKKLGQGEVLTYTAPGTNWTATPGSIVIALNDDYYQTSTMSDNSSQRNRDKVYPGQAYGTRHLVYLEMTTNGCALLVLDGKEVVPLQPPYSANDTGTATNNFASGIGFELLSETRAVMHDLSLHAPGNLLTVAQVKALWDAK